jgi:uncharacterized protein YndB with AHSA1/START domain
MITQPIIIETILHADIAKVWKAITDKAEMKNWYFDLTEFSPTVGFRFQFASGPSPERIYNHLCEVKEVVAEKKLSYSWAYEGYEGNTLVTFALTEMDQYTQLYFTHEGVDTFPKTNPDFAVENFITGWHQIILSSLKNYVEKS